MKDKIKDKNILQSALSSSIVKKLYDDKKNILFLWGPVVIALISLVVAFYFYHKFENIKQHPQEASQKELNNAIAKIGALIVLPEGETPTLATVTDPERLKDQPFFANAVRGDQVLIYTNAKKAILYDPVKNKIVEVAPINLGNQPNANPPENSTKTSK